MLFATSQLDSLRSAWLERWPEALAAWSKYVRLSPPRWCMTVEEELKEQLTGSFAMIRLVDHAVVISLRQVAERGLEKFAVEVMAHEIGHHVYTPADLTDNARVQARIRYGLPTKERFAPMIANLYEDLLINDRLQRSVGLDMAGVYKQLDLRSTDKLWTLYTRMYELLWSLPRETLAHGAMDKRMEVDAQLGARLIRSYAKHWLDGAGRFAALCLPYLMEDVEKMKACGAWWDSLTAGAGGFPDGMTEIDPEELEGAIHPSEDPDLSGVVREGEGAHGRGAAKIGGHKSLKRYRDPFEYGELLKAAGVTLPEDQIVARYYRERALPHLVRFPTRPQPRAMDPIPEGLDVWDVGQPLEQIDWPGTLMGGPVVVPGLTTRERLYGDSQGGDPQRAPIDLYLGVDCSGSMHNPAHTLSYPVLAGTIIAISALRTGSRVMVVLSGEPGRSISTDGFTRDEQQVLKILTGYLGTGTTFGIHRLDKTFADRSPQSRAVHILIVSDTDIFSVLEAKVGDRVGWDVARESVEKARGGGTYVLNLPGSFDGGFQFEVKRMTQEGWSVARVSTWDELLVFARRFSEARYGR